jgi:uncharacterized delta-60 repeat protein
MLNGLCDMCRAAPALLALGIVSPTTLAATGDLDAGFADVGRLVLPDFLGPASFVAAQDDSIFLAGGKVVHDFNSQLDDKAFGFARRVSSAGTPDPTYAAPGLDGIRVVDAELQSDGKIVGVGGRSSDRGIQSVVFRLKRDGSLDDTFGLDGVVGLTVTEVQSVAVDPGGTIVIAGVSYGDFPRNSLVVLRLLSTGQPDGSFGTAGAFGIGADVEEYFTPSRILSTENGGYRIAETHSAWQDPSKCRVLALTANGAVDETFGDHGYAEIQTSAVSVCHSMVELPDGRLMVAGTADARPLVFRVDAGGSVDPSFVAESLADTTLNVATDIAVDPNNGSIVVAFDDTPDSAGEPGLVVARLQAEGALDQLFGDGGATWVDLPEIDGNTTFARPGDVTVLENSDVLVSGGVGTAFVARLVGGSGHDSPGVLGVRNFRVQTTEDAQQAIVKFRRMGGKAGSVSLAYETQATPGDVFHATEGQDFTAVSGRLQWADGDAGDKQFVVPIAPDDGSLEETEQFAVQLSDVQGGAGTGTRETTVFIASDAPSAGMFSIESDEIRVEEGNAWNPGERIAPVSISRGYYDEGAVSVTVTMSSGTATSYEDFSGDPVTVSWADGDHNLKVVEVIIYDDSSAEPQEQFSLQLSDATGGAIIGPRDTATVLIADDDPTPPPPPPPPPPPDGGGGGGPVGFISLLLLGIARLIAAAADGHGNGAEDDSRATTAR